MTIQHHHLMFIFLCLHAWNEFADADSLWLDALLVANPHLFSNTVIFLMARHTLFIEDWKGTTLLL